MVPTMPRNAGIASELETLLEMEGKGMILICLAGFLLQAGGTLALLWYCMGPTSAVSRRRKSRAAGFKSKAKWDDAGLKKHRVRRVREGAWRSQTDLLIERRGINQRISNESVLRSECNCQGEGTCAHDSAVAWIDEGYLAHKNPGP
ncbi:hypothetical protein T484DRAFT_1920520 [Baffinella frigidus]|nr:hypothetical protein T484DRAFT_1920520 [Cryptophyta sp. CCMP2293]